MADAATTGTLVVVALSGGAGALFGAILGQAVQLHRDRKQHEREDRRHERERQQALEDARTIRREERYVALLTELGTLDRQIQKCAEMVTLWVGLRSVTDDHRAKQEDRDNLGESLRSITEYGRTYYDEYLRAVGATRTAFAAAYPVASASVRKVGSKVAEAPSSFRFEALEDEGSRLLLYAPSGPQLASPAEYGAEVLQEFEATRELVSELDRLVRSELRLD